MNGLEEDPLYTSPARDAQQANGTSEVQTALPRASEQAYNQLRREILLGELKPKTVLQEKEIAERIGVSRTPVREAMSRLQAEGLIVMQRYRKHYVAEFEESDRVEIFEIRAMLEGHAAALASQRLTDEQIAHLREVCAKTEKAIADKGDDARSVFQEFNRDFHSMIWAAADRPRMMGLLDTSLSLPFNTLGRYSENLTATMQRACWYHREIVAAFKARDEHRARTQMSAHVLSLISTDLP